MKTNNIILTGMPGSGKTTVGQVLSFKTGIEFIDLDLLIEQKEKTKISTIFEKFGEKHFRKLETENLQVLMNKRQPFILATGGGTVENNSQILKKLGMVFYLKIPSEKIYKRIANDKTRPLLQKKDPMAALNEIFKKRKEYYEKADFTIDAAKPANEIADRIIYEKNNGSN